MPFDDGFAVMKDALDINPEFQTFHKFCLNNKIPFNVISAGLKPVLRRVLDHHQMVLSGSLSGSTILSSATIRLNLSMVTENMLNSKVMMGSSL
jgi:2-hydroxy-3-keto-5-methylthiopentenyl-1-phosphate phosphatase